MKINLFAKINSIVLVLILTIILLTKPTYSFYLSFYPAGNDDGRVIMVTGDSYAGFFAGFECLRDYNFLIYADAGKSTKENFEMMKAAVNDYPDTVIISLGVNDHNKLETPEDFGKRIEELILICKEKYKRVILHTYMSYDDAEFSGSKNIYSVSDFDDELKRLGKKYNNTFYIDMSDYNSEVFWQEDKIHYNKLFYDELYNRITTALMLF